MRLTIIAAGICVLLSGCNSNNDRGPVPPEPPLPPAPTTPTYDFSDLRESMDVAMLFNNAKAASVAVSKGGDIIFAETFGENFVGGAELDSDTQFQLGSTSKMLSALGLLRLEEQGLLQVDDDLVAHLPEIQYPAQYADLWGDIQIHELLSQQSGLLDWNDFEVEYVGEDLHQFAVVDYPQVPPMTRAGQFYSYANPNYVYIGMLIDSLSGDSFGDYMQQNVFDALGMSLTTVSRDAVAERGNFALGTGLDGQLLNDITEVGVDPVGLAAGTGTWSTPSDMLKMAYFLLNGNDEILSSERREKLTAKHIPIDEFGVKVRAYGYGIAVHDGLLIDEHTYYPIQFWEHDGGTDYYGSLFYVFPEHDLAISIMVNNDSTDYEQTIVELLRTMDILPDAEPAPVEPVDESRYSEYVGSYSGMSLWGPATANVTLDNGELIVEMPELTAMGVEYFPVMQPTYGTTMNFQVDSETVIRLTFRDMDDEAGMDVISARHLVLHREGYQP